MPIRFVCQNGHKLNAKDELAGRTVRCPKCKVPVVIEELVIAEEGAAAEPFAFGNLEPDDPDPFAEPFASPEPSASPSIGQSYGYSFPDATQQNQPARNTTAGKKAAATSATSQNLFWKLRFAIAGAGIFCCLLLLGLLVVLMKPGDSSRASSGNTASSEKDLPRLIRSKMMLEETVKMMAKAKAASERGPFTNEQFDANKVPLTNEQLIAEIEKSIEKSNKDLIELFPESGMVTEATEERLRMGTPDPTVMVRINALDRALDEVLKIKRSGGMDLSTASPTRLCFWGRRTRKPFQNS